MESKNFTRAGRVLAHSIIFRHRKIADKFPVTLTNELRSARIERVLPESGPVAQLGARFHGMEEVIGSIPIRSTKSFQAFSRSPPKPFARILPANCKIFPRDGTTVFFSSFPEPFFGSIVELRAWVKTP